MSEGEYIEELENRLDSLSGAGKVSRGANVDLGKIGPGRPLMRPRTSLALARELEFARGRFPDPRKLFAALVEEVGELARELLENGVSHHARFEALQVATTAIRIVEEGDPMYQQEREEDERERAELRREVDAVLMRLDDATADGRTPPGVRDLYSLAATAIRRQRGEGEG